MPRRRSEAGNALVLMPVAVLVILGLGAMAVDAALAFRTRSELDTLAAGLANDAAAAIAVDDWFTGQAATPSRRLVDDLVAGRIAAVDSDLDPACTAAVDAAAVTVTCTGTATYVFHHVVGLPRTGQVSARATADLRSG